MANCEFRIHADTWNNGEGDLVSTWNEQISGDTIDQLLNDVVYLNCNHMSYDNDIMKLFECDPCHEGDFSRFDASLTVNYHNEQMCKPTNDEVEQWKAGKIDLYTMYISLHVQKVCDLDETDVPKVYIANKYAC